MARRFVGGLVAVLLLGGLPSDSGAKKRPRAPRGLGVFPASGGVIVSAGECRGTGRHRRAKHNPKVVALVCGVATATSPPVPPFDAPCLSAGYAEFHGRRQREWTSSTSFSLGTDGMVVQTSSVIAHVASFDGTYVRGTFTGIFDTPQQAGAPAAVAIDGAGSFYLAVTIGN